MHSSTYSASSTEGQGVVTYMSCVKAFATGIKIESSDQKPFLGADQGIKVASELIKSDSRVGLCYLCLDHPVAWLQFDL